MSQSGKNLRLSIKLLKKCHLAIILAINISYVSLFSFPSQIATQVVKRINFSAIHAESPILRLCSRADVRLGQADQRVPAPGRRHIRRRARAPPRVERRLRVVPLPELERRLLPAAVRLVRLAGILAPAGHAAD